MDKVGKVYTHIQAVVDSSHETNININSPTNGESTWVIVSRALHFHIYQKWPICNHVFSLQISCFIFYLSNLDKITLISPQYLQECLDKAGTGRTITIVTD